MREGRKEERQKQKSAWNLPVQENQPQRNCIYEINAPGSEVKAKFSIGWLVNFVDGFCTLSTV